MDWVHLHLALNHVPVLGTVFVGLLLAVALIRKSDELKRVSLVAFVALAVVSIPIKFTGDFAHEKLTKAEWLDQSRAVAHEQMADQATTGMFLLGLVAAFALWQGRGGGAPRHQVPAPPQSGAPKFRHSGTCCRRRPRRTAC